MKHEPQSLVWTESGRQFVAKVGRLTISVRCKGSRDRGDLQWILGEVFGQHYFGVGWHDCLDDAIAEAEAVARKEAAHFVAAARPFIGGRGRS